MQPYSGVPKNRSRTAQTYRARSPPWESIRYLELGGFTNHYLVTTGLVQFWTPNGNTLSKQFITHIFIQGYTTWTLTRSYWNGIALMKVFSTEPTKCYNWIYTISKNAQEYLHHQKQYVFLKVQHYFALWTLGLGSENWYGDWLPCAWQVGVGGQEGRGKQFRQTARRCLLTPTQTPLFISKLDVRQYKRTTLAVQDGHIGGMFAPPAVHWGGETWGVAQRSRGRRPRAKATGSCWLPVCLQVTPAAHATLPGPFPTVRFRDVLISKKSERKVGGQQPSGEDRLWRPATSQKQKREWLELPRKETRRTRKSVETLPTYHHPSGCPYVFPKKKLMTTITWLANTHQIQVKTNKTENFPPEKAFCTLFLEGNQQFINKP